MRVTSLREELVENDGLKAADLGHVRGSCACGLRTIVGKEGQGRRCCCRYRCGVYDIALLPKKAKSGLPDDPRRTFDVTCHWNEDDLGKSLYKREARTFERYLMIVYWGTTKSKAATGYVNPVGFVRRRLSPRRSSPSVVVGFIVSKTSI